MLGVVLYYMHNHGGHNASFDEFMGRDYTSYIINLEQTNTRRMNNGKNTICRIARSLRCGLTI